MLQLTAAHLIPCLAAMAEGTLSQVDSTTDEAFPLRWTVHLQDATEVEVLYQKLLNVFNGNPGPLECRMDLNFDATRVGTEPSTSSQPQQRDFTHLYTPISPEGVTVCEADSTTRYVQPKPWVLIINNVYKVELVCNRLKELMVQDPGLRFQIDIHFIWRAPARGSSSDSSPSTTDEEDD